MQWSFGLEHQIGTTASIARSIRRHARGQPALPDAGERLSNGLPGLLCAVSLRAADRSAIRRRDAIVHRREQPLQRLATHRRQSAWATVFRAGQLHLEPLHGHRLERRIPAIFRGRNSLAASGRLGARLWPLRLRRPPQSQRAVRLSIAGQSSKTGFSATR